MMNTSDCLFEFSISSDKCKTNVNFPRPEGYDYYLKTPMDFLVVCQGEFVSATILFNLEALTRSKVASLNLTYNADDLWVDASIEFLQQRLFRAVCEKTIIRSIKKLEELGFIVKHAGTGRRSSKYQIQYKTLWECCRKCYTALGEGKFNFHEASEELSKPLTMTAYAQPVLNQIEGGQSVYPGKFEGGQNVYPGWTNCLPREDKMSTQGGQNVQQDNNNKNNNIYLKCITIPSTDINTVLIENSLPKGLEEENLQSKENLQINNNPNQEESMNLESIQSVLKVYTSGGSKFKKAEFSKSVKNLTERYGVKLSAIIQDFGEESTIEGIRAFLQDSYWQENGLPLTAFLKLHYQWIPSPDATETTPSEPEKKKVPKYQKTFSASPSPSNAQQSAFKTESVVTVAPPADQSRLRVMRRNEALMILNACKSKLFNDFREKSQPGMFENLSDIEVDDWFDRACQEFKSITGGDPPVSSRPVSTKGDL